ncbi:metal ABC transporter permease [Salinicola sp. LHM]|uniref:metal ABC transporter permease n=1 Tax=Salinicola sp. LHM TaxID=3065298 RepID=UPI002ACD7824|nr:metal ABC transporter permease [Salinicola sp. LHM]WQH32716.1 metal ABC transporter permease [Salinicola sp. LHM]
MTIGTLTSFVGAYASYFLDGATGGIIVVLQTTIFLVAFVFAPKHGMLAARRRAAASLAREPARQPLSSAPLSESQEPDEEPRP